MGATSRRGHLSRLWRVTWEVMSRVLVRGGATTHPLVDEPAPEPEIAMPPLRILLAEDSLANQKVALAMLDGFGHEITTVQTGRRAADLASTREFDLVLMDLEMPEMDGTEAAMAIREAERRRDRRVPILAMTAHAVQGTRERCLAAGMDDYVSKPIRRAHLLEAIARMAGGIAARHAEPLREEAPRPVTRVLDWSALVDQVGGNRDALHGIVEAYLREIRESLTQLERGLREGEARKVRLHAHVLVGTMRTFGAGDGMTCARAIETAALRGDTTGLSGAFRGLQTAAEAMLPELQRFVETGRLPH